MTCLPAILSRPWLACHSGIQHDKGALAGAFAERQIERDGLSVGQEENRDQRDDRCEARVNPEQSEVMLVQCISPGEVGDVKWWLKHHFTPTHPGDTWVRRACSILYIGALRHLSS
jgi:hypothetical protein